MLTENYRGITITSIHGKVFEYILLEKTPIAKDGQSNMQFGFTDLLPKYGCTNTERSLFQHYSKRYTVYYNTR